MKLLLLISVFTVGLYPDTVVSYDNSPLQSRFYEVENESPREREILVESSKYGLLSFVPWRYRITREIGGINSKLPHIEKKIKNFCNDSKELINSIDQMKLCMSTKHIFVVQRDEYIEHIDTCSRDTRNVLKKCLPEKLQYFPDFFISLVESVVKLLYDDFGEIARGLSPCMQKLNEQASRDYYEDCVEKQGQDIQDEILKSKKIFCDKFLQVSECFVKQLNATCTKNSDLDKFQKDYMIAMERPCK